MEDSKIIELYENRDQQAISQSDIKYGGYCYSVGYNILGVREDTEECIPDNATTESLCDGRHLEWLINEFLGELQERDRNIFLQRYWFATPIKEISKKYAMNLNTVKASLFRSRNKLKALLEKEGVLL